MSENPSFAPDQPTAPDTKLILEYLKEHYAAARHHQTMRLQTMTIIASAAGLVFINGVTIQKSYLAPFTLGAVLMALGCFAFLLNRSFHRANRFHVETAGFARKALTKTQLGGNKLNVDDRALVNAQVADPGLIGKAVSHVFKKKMEERKGNWNVGDEEYDTAVRAALNKQALKQPKIEEQIRKILNLIPFFVVAGGLILFLRFLFRFSMKLC